MLWRFWNWAKGIVDIERNIRFEIGNNAKPHADLVGVLVRKTVQNLGLTVERRIDNKVTVPVNFSLLSTGFGD